MTDPQLTEASAAHLATLALNCVQREFPNRLDQTINDPSDLQSPRAIHPAFYGCFDWHSAVHGHWMLVRLLKTFPNLRQAAVIRTTLAQNLSEQNLFAEAAYLQRPGTDGFERPYGWAWLLKLAQELLTWNVAEAKALSHNLKPLADAIVNRYLNYLPKLAYPLRTGTHSNTAFGLAFALDFAEETKTQALATLVRNRSVHYYGKDRAYPAAWEPGGEDFFSASLMEADLMRRVLDRFEFAEWFCAFLPDLANGEPKQLLEPAVVTDRSDGRLVHLDGLNLSRAWCMRNIATALGENMPSRHVLLESAGLHAASGLTNVASGNYMGEHWLATFAVYMLSMNVWHADQSGPM